MPYFRCSERRKHPRSMEQVNGSIQLMGGAFGQGTDRRTGNEDRSIPIPL